MYRIAITEMQKWKARPRRKPLVLRGARQVGKTWLMKEFARTAYDHSVYINFEDEEALRHVFENDFDIGRILESFELRFGTHIVDNTLLIFDEIQSARRGITSLKYFQEKAPHIHLMAADSLLGLSSTESIPVGKVDYLDLHPMTFTEFLHAIGKEREAHLVTEGRHDLLAVVRDQLIHDLKTYYFVGGMPEAVQCFAESRDYDEVRRIQRDILTSYDSNFAKHAPGDVVARIRLVWNSLPSQLARENKKFIYGAVRTGGRAKEFELALQWLQDAGLVQRVSRAKCAQVPLKAFEDTAAFKLFALDVGLLSAMNKLQANTLVNGNELFAMFKGALTEQYVAQHLNIYADQVCYWSAENSRGEIDFLTQTGDHITPIEVKAEENLRARSLRVFVDNNPGLRGLRLSMSDFRHQDWMDNVPLYALSQKSLFV